MIISINIGGYNISYDRDMGKVTMEEQPDGAMIIGFESGARVVIDSSGVIVNSEEGLCRVTVGSEKNPDFRVTHNHDGPIAPSMRKDTDPPRVH